LTPGSWQRPSRLQTAVQGAANTPTHWLDLSIGRNGMGLGFEAGATLLFEEAVDAELRGALSWEGDCGCWRGRTWATRHVTQPEWDVGVGFELVPGADWFSCSEK